MSCENAAGRLFPHPVREDLARTPEAVESPSWHKDTLAERARHVADGTSRFTDWETAKANIRSSL
ncbi:MAG: addiction module protein [Nitrospira defluvii]|nr:addiction module protein [Nitrospira defluvii]